LFQEQKYNLIM